MIVLQHHVPDRVFNGSAMNDRALPGSRHTGIDAFDGRKENPFFLQQMLRELRVDSVEQLPQRIEQPAMLSAMSARNFMHQLIETQQLRFRKNMMPVEDMIGKTDSGTAFQSVEGVSS